MNIIEIVKNNNLNLLKDNLKYSDINIVDENSDSLLMIAINNNNLDIVRFLVLNAININYKNNDGNTAVHIAVKKNYLAILKFLLRNNAKFDLQNNDLETPFMLALRYQRKEMVQMLCEFKPNLDYKNRYNEDISFYAIYYHDDMFFKEIEALHDFEAERNLNNDTLLHLSTKLGYIDFSTYLMKYHILVHVRNNMLETPLFIACSKSNLEHIALLIDNMALLDIKNKFNETIEDVSSKKTMEYVVLKSSSVQYQTYLKKYPLHIYVIKNDIINAKTYFTILNKNKKDNFTYLASDYANKLNYPNLIKLFNK